VITLPDILLQQIVFLATAADADVHPDVAVAQLEALVYAIAQLPDAERASFNARLRARMSAASGVELKALRELEESLA
jgi:hypothetical protein